MTLSKSYSDSRLQYRSNIFTIRGRRYFRFAGCLCAVGHGHFSEYESTLSERNGVSGPDDTIGIWFSVDERMITAAEIEQIGYTVLTHKLAVFAGDQGIINDYIAGGTAANQQRSAADRPRFTAQRSGCRGKKQVHLLISPQAARVSHLITTRTLQRTAMVLFDCRHPGRVVTRAENIFDDTGILNELIPFADQ
jgi:hypothetical protein